MSAIIIFQILCFYLVLDDVSSECDRTNGPLGLTDCVLSPQYAKYQAAVCLPRTMSSLNKHVTCAGKTTNFCWYLCNTAPSHGGLSACQCDPDSKTERNNSPLDKECYLPTKDCSWFSKCLKKKYDCNSITHAENKCKKLRGLVKLSVLKLSKLALGWVWKVTSCIQRDLLHLLYPQIKSDCEKIGKVIDQSTNTCYYEPHSGICTLTFLDEVILLKYGFETKRFHCKFQKTVPDWAKLLVFYVRNDSPKDYNTLAFEFGESLSKKFNWNSDLTYNSMASETTNCKSKPIKIRFYLYSKTKKLKQINVANDDLKKYIEEGNMKDLELKDKAPVFIVRVMSCIDTLCSPAFTFFFYQAPCKKINIIKRKDWGAREPRQITYIEDENSPVIWVFIHHTVTDTCFNVEDCISRAKLVQNSHMDDA
ncbi:uncharacterized protein LOC134233856, partial [Saccostrea cucullata]|uniref:uncharacterized protein LOC134233856 n=1 Tax=Saccostrea cuccullata TaxID=36930 RepID=UPI002ED251D6